MKALLSRKDKETHKHEGDWPRKVQPGREIVTVYRRTTPSGNHAFMIANYANGKRRFDSYATEEAALDAAEQLAKQLDRRDYVASNLTRAEAIEYADAAEALKPFGVKVRSAVATVAQCLQLVGDLSNLQAAAKYYAARHKQAVKRPTAEVVAELLKIKEGRGASKRYMDDLRYRLNRFAGDCPKDSCNVTTADLQEWLDGQKLSPQGYTNFRRVLYLFFKFAEARGYAADNPVERVERVKVRGGDVEIFTPMEISRLLASADPDFLPCIAIGAFAGLRSAEIERLEWQNIDLPARHIVVGASRAKTASRRIVPIHDNLAQWLAPYAGREGKVWKGTHEEFYESQQETAAATEVLEDKVKGIRAEKPVKWKANALRHSYASYRFAQTGDAGRVAGELGNSAAVVHRHYRELVKPQDAVAWFSVGPDSEANVVILARSV